jgi:hypothetical protein
MLNLQASVSILGNMKYLLGAWPNLWFNDAFFRTMLPV